MLLGLALTAAPWWLTSISTAEASERCSPFETTSTTSTTDPLAPSTTTTAPPSSTTTTTPYCVEVMAHDVERLRAEVLVGLSLLVILGAVAVVLLLVLLAR